MWDWMNFSCNRENYLLEDTESRHLILIQSGIELMSVLNLSFWAGLSISISLLLCFQGGASPSGFLLLGEPQTLIGSPSMGRLPKAPSLFQRLLTPPHNSWRMTQGEMELNLNLSFALFCLNFFILQFLLPNYILMPSKRYIFPIVPIDGRFVLKESSLPSLETESRVNDLM